MGLLVFLLVVLAGLIVWEAVDRVKRKRREFYRRYGAERK
jgi:hypothetical protein